MTSKIRKIQINGYKTKDGEGTQKGYKGVAFSPIEQELTLRVNELIDVVNGIVCGQEKTEKQSLPSPNQKHDSKPEKYRDSKYEI